MAENIGRVISVSGPAVDVQFEEKTMPPIYQALRIVTDGFDVPQPLSVIVEVEQHLGEGRVRCIAMVATEGMVRGMKAIDTGAVITVPVGRATLGRVINVLGEPVDEVAPSIDRIRPDPSPGASVRRTVDQRGDVRDRNQGHRPDPAVPQGRKDRTVWRRGHRQDGHHPGTDQ